MEDDKKFVPFPHFGTDALHAGQEPEQWKSMAVVPPISMSTTFKQPAPAEHVVGNMCSYVAYCTLYNYLALNSGRYDGFLFYVII